MRARPNVHHSQPKPDAESAPLWPNDILQGLNRLCIFTRPKLCWVSAFTPGKAINQHRGIYNRVQPLSERWIPQDLIGIRLADLSLHGSDSHVCLALRP